MARTLEEKREAVRRWRLENAEKVAADNSRRRQRQDARLRNKWKKKWCWVNSRCGRQKGYKTVECRITWQDLAKIWFRDEAWMMRRPELDRINPDGHYEFDNLRYIEQKENLERRVWRCKKVKSREPGQEG